MRENTVTAEIGKTRIDPGQQFELIAVIPVFLACSKRNQSTGSEFSDATERANVKPEIFLESSNLKTPSDNNG